MDAVEFIKTKRRMCHTIDNCNNCPFSECANQDIEIISVVEEWAKAHPANTRQGRLLEIFPNTDTSNTGIVDLCPACMETNFDCPKNTTCDVCKKGYWLEEIE